MVAQIHVGTSTNSSSRNRAALADRVNAPIPMASSHRAATKAADEVSARMTALKLLGVPTRRPRMKSQQATATRARATSANGVAAPSACEAVRGGLSQESSQ